MTTLEVNGWSSSRWRFNSHSSSSCSSLGRFGQLANCSALNHIIDLLQEVFCCVTEFVGASRAGMAMAAKAIVSDRAIRIRSPETTDFFDDRHGITGRCRPVNGRRVDANFHWKEITLLESKNPNFAWIKPLYFDLEIKNPKFGFTKKMLDFIREKESTRQRI